MAMQPTHPDWGTLFTAEALKCLEKERVWDVLVRILTSQVLNLLHRRVVVVSAVMAALLPPALVALPYFSLSKGRCEAFF